MMMSKGENKLNVEQSEDLVFITSNVVPDSSSNGSRDSVVLRDYGPKISMTGSMDNRGTSTEGGDDAAEATFVTEQMSDEDLHD